MGSSHWNEDFYNDRVAERARTGAETFAYSASTAAKPRHEQVVHEKMSPKGVTRESRDSKEHPNATPIGIMLDVTGSMATLFEVAGRIINQTVQTYIEQLIFLGRSDFGTALGAFRLAVTTSSVALRNHPDVVCGLQQVQPRLLSFDQPFSIDKL